MWRAFVVLEAVLLVLFVHRRVYLRWPALVSFLAVLVARDAILFVADYHGSLYLWTYYIGSALAGIAEVVLITEIGLKLVGPLQSLRGIVSRNVPAMVVTFICGAMLASLPGHPQAGIPHIATLVYYCRRLDLAVSAGCAAGLVMLIGIAFSLKIQFSHGVRPVAIGLLVEVSSSYMQSVFFMDGWVAQTIFPNVRSATFLLTLLCFSAPALHAMIRDRATLAPPSLPVNNTRNLI